MNLDLPQFEEGLEGWSEVTSAYDLAPVIHSIPVAIQVFNESGRTVCTGILTSTDDVYGDENAEGPTRSVFYFKEAQSLSITWSKTKAVLAMVAIVTEKGHEDVDQESAD